ncbi:hypothetical protein like AT1G25370 [Hibiscus trionum]|nr:hypothetical protein like AT1G25370 [Hibiscus trionum]
MVFSGDKKMAVEPERSKPLHNFSLPSLKWGNQRYLGCLKLDDTSTPVDALRRLRLHEVQGRRSPLSKFERSMVSRMRRPEYDRGREQQLRISEGEAAEGIGEVREKIMKDLKTAADNLMGAAFSDEVSDEDEFKETIRKVKEKEKEESPARPWNLRTRRPVGEGANNIYSSPSVASSADKKRPRPKFSVPLSKKEIEQDFMVMTGRRPPSRPKKRARHVQKQLDSVFPGLWLTEVSADSYKVPEMVETGKRLTTKPMPDGNALNQD